MDQQNNQLELKLENVTQQHVYPHQYRPEASDDYKVDDDAKEEEEIFEDVGGIQFEIYPKFDNNVHLLYVTPRS